MEEQNVKFKEKPFVIEEELENVITKDVANLHFHIDLKDG